MNLESIEQEVLKYLRHVANPVVPIQTLFDRLQRRQGGVELTVEELTTFLRRHELFRVLEAAGAGGGRQEALEDAGLLSGLCVVLDTRVPTPPQMIDLMEEQLEGMSRALEGALAQARDAGDAQSLRVIRDALARAQKIRAQLDGLESETPEPPD